MLTAETQRYREEKGVGNNRRLQNPGWRSAAILAARVLPAHFQAAKIAALQLLQWPHKSAFNFSSPPCLRDTIRQNPRGPRGFLGKRRRAAILAAAASNVCGALENPHAFRESKLLRPGWPRADGVAAPPRCVIRGSK